MEWSRCRYCIASSRLFTCKCAKTTSMNAHWQAEGTKQTVDCNGWLSLWLGWYRLAAENALWERWTESILPKTIRRHGNISCQYPDIFAPFGLDSTLVGIGLWWKSES
jgi:hypothetical protein